MSLQDETLVTAVELSEVLGVSRARIYELAREGVLPVVRLGRTIRFSKQVVQAFIENGGKSWPNQWRKSSDEAL